MEEASSLFAVLITLPSHSEGLDIVALADPKADLTAQRYARFLNTDPSISFEIFPPSTEAAESCRAQIRDALALLDAGDPDLAGEIRALLRQIVLASGSKDPKAYTFDGASSFMLWGAIIINADRRDGAIGMTQMLAHESAHNLLFGFSADESLVENSPDELFSSPLRKDPRPMDGIYHATFVTARMYRVVHRLIESGVLDAASKEKAEKDLADNARLFKQGIETVQRHAKLTPLGESVMRGAADYIGGGFLDGQVLQIRSLRRLDAVKALGLADGIGVDDLQRLAGAGKVGHKECIPRSVGQRICPLDTIRTQRNTIEA